MQNLYALSELAQELIKGHARIHNWSITSYPGKVKMPVDIFRGLPNPEAANKASLLVVDLVVRPFDNAADTENAIPP